MSHLTPSARHHARFVVLVAAALLATACGSPDPPPVSPAPPASPSPTAVSSDDPGFGHHHHAIATKNTEAQKAFDRGFDFVFGFNHEEAARAFAKAAELDPSAAMPLWGVAWAIGPNYNLDIDDARSKQAYDAMQKAVALAKNGPAEERAYVEAMAIRFSPDPKADRAALARQYADRMAAVVKQYPDDLDAATLYAESLMNLRAWKLWTLDGKPADRTDEIVRVLEGVLARDPDHLGANHYYIHTVEASPTPARALASAERLRTLAPRAGHLVHMPAHILARTGDHDGAAKANLAGADADRAFLVDKPADNFYGMAYYSHNLHFLADSEMMQGRYDEARTAAAGLTERLGPMAGMMPMGESMVAMRYSVPLRFAKHDDALAMAAPPTDRPVETAWYHFMLGVSLARSGKVDEAMKERTAMQAAAGTVPDSALFGGTGLESAKTILTLAGVVLDARLAWARGAKPDAIASWRKAVALADAVPYDEPPVWFYPVRESLGAALLLSGDAAAAEKVFRDDLVRFPRNPRSLFGLHESLVAQKKTADAAWVKQAFDAAWAKASGPLTLEML
jgi:tetratricopeptide (TPR) repeat protein